MLEPMLITMAIVSFLGMIADKEKDNRKNFTYAFVTTVLAIVALKVLK